MKVRDVERRMQISARTCQRIAVRGLTIGVLSLLAGCQQPEIDPTVVDSGFDSLVVTVGDSGEMADVTVGGGSDVATDAGADLAAPDSGGADGGDASVDNAAVMDATVDVTSNDLPPEIGPPDTLAIGPCGAGFPPLTPMGWSATASVQSPGDVPARAFDGQLNSRWSTGIFAAVGHWYRLDLGRARTINRFQLDTGAMFPLDFPPGYAVTLSLDDLTYHQVATGAGTTQLTTVSFPAEAARYVKITLTARNPQHWWAIAELITCGY